MDVLSVPYYEEESAGTYYRQYGFDAYGNRWVQGYAGVPLDVYTPTAQAQINASTNRLVMAGVNFDTAGNQNQIRGYAATYDAENRLRTVGTPSGTVTSDYDGEGRRVRKTSGVEAVYFVYDIFGRVIAEYGGQVAVTGRKFLTTDHLGSTRVVTNASGDVVARHDYFGYGEEYPLINGRTTAMRYQPTIKERKQFTGKERDQESGLDNFLARFYAPILGRFTSPDEFTGGPKDIFKGDTATSGPLPYADIANPQSLNKYAYVYNSPLTFTDPDGHCPLCISTGVGLLTGGAVSLISQKWAHPDKPINWDSVFTASMGGAVAGATLGLLTAPAAITTISGATLLETGASVEIGAGAISAVIGGVVKRETEAVLTGRDMNVAIGTPGQMVSDAIGGGAATAVNLQLIKPMVKESSYVGRAVSVGEQKIAQGVRPSPNLPVRREQLKKLQTTASAIGSIVTKSYVRRVIEEGNK